MANTPIDCDKCTETTPGGRLRFLRERLGLSIEDLATEIGVHPHTVSAWERDTWTVTQMACTIMAAKTGVKAEWIKPFQSGEERRKYFGDLRMHNLIVALWPQKDHPEEEGEIEKRIREAAVLYPNKVNRETFFKYYFENTQKEDIAGSIKRSIALVSRAAKDVVQHILASARGRRILDGESGDLRLSDPVYDLVDFPKRHHVKLGNVGVTTVGELIERYHNLREQGEISQRLAGAALESLRRNGLEPKCKAAADKAKDNFSVLYGILYSGQEVDRDDALRRVDSALVLVPVPRNVAIFKQYYFAGKTLKDVGEEYGITRERVRQVVDTVSRELRKNPDCAKVLRAQTLPGGAVTISSPLAALGLKKYLFSMLTSHGIDSVGALVDAIESRKIGNIRTLGPRKVNGIIQRLKQVGIEVSVRSSIKPKRPFGDIFLTVEEISAGICSSIPTAYKRAEREKWKAEPDSSPVRYLLSSMLKATQAAVLRKRYTLEQIATLLNRRPRGLEKTVKTEEWPYLLKKNSFGGEVREYLFCTLPKDIRTAIKTAERQRGTERDEKKLKGLTAGEITLVKVMRLKQIKPEDVLKELLDRM